MAEEKPPIVIDNGSFSLKAGLAGDEEPVHIRSIVARTRPYRPRSKLNERFVGIRAEELADEDRLAVVRHPVRQGIYSVEDNMEALWDFAFQKLHVEPREHCVLLSECPVNNRFKRREIAEIMFESYKVGSMYLASTANLVLYGAGKNTGFVVESGGDITRTVPIYEGYALQRDINTLYLGGETLTDYMKSLLAIRGLQFKGYAGLNDVRNLKEQFGFVAKNIDDAFAEAEAKGEIQHELSDGRTVTLNDERFRVPEVLFNPKEVIHYIEGLPRIIQHTIKRTERKIHKELYGNIILAGGNTMFPGIEERMRRELARLAPKDVKINITAVPDRVNLVWHGGSKLALSENFQRFWVSSKSYYEHGIREKTERFNMH